jgi:uncharacterized protein (DUF697 family)
LQLKINNNMSSKKDKAQTWVNGYAVAGAAAVAAAVFPGSTSAALIAIEGHMCYQIGKIYRGDDYSLSEGIAVAGVIGLASIGAKLVALEALNFVPFAGWVVKAPIAGGVIKILGEVIIAHYEKLED